MSISFIYVNGEYNFSFLLRYYIIATPRVSIEFEDTVRSVELINTGVEINIITLNLARRAGFPIRDGFRFINMVSQTGHSRGLGNKESVYQDKVNYKYDIYIGDRGSK